MGEVGDLSLRSRCVPKLPEVGHVTMHKLSTRGSKEPEYYRSSSPKTLSLKDPYLA